MILKGDRPASYSHEEETTNAETKENINTINKFHFIFLKTGIQKAPERHLGEQPSTLWVEGRAKGKVKRHST